MKAGVHLLNRCGQGLTKDHSIVSENFPVEDY